MERLSALQIYLAARQGGFSRDDAVTWTAIALAESGGNPRAHATRGEDSRGLWQINLNAHSNTWGDLYDPVVNARAAFEVSRGARTLQPWSVTHARNAGTARDYRHYLDQAHVAAAAAPGGNPFGDGGTGTAGPGAADVQSLAFGGVDAPGPVCQPISHGRLTDTFGAPRSGGRRHEGIDIFAPQGTPIHAIASGTVVQGFSNSLGGVVVRIQGDDGRYYYYAHLKPGSQSHLHVGEHVNAGQVIGGVGHTGDAATTPTHLHLQVRSSGGEWVNPFGFLQGLPDIEDVAGGAVGVTAGAATDAFAIDSGAPPSVADTDHDGLTDQFEKIFGTNPNLADTDADGLSDAYETGTSHTNPLDKDTDRDGRSDAYEVAHGTDPGRALIPDAARAAGFGGLANVDSDSDGLSDAYEARIHTDPLVADTDADGLSDGYEAAHGSNPLLVDSDADGLTDGFEAGAGTLQPAGVPGAAPGADVMDGAVGADPNDPLLDAGGTGHLP
jgi:murein DD-endopeptidase MepM/ murein hydrolase activator NlpD